jgi:thermopsin
MRMRVVVAVVIALVIGSSAWAALPLGHEGPGAAASTADRGSTAASTAHPNAPVSTAPAPNDLAQRLALQNHVLTTLHDAGVPQKYQYLPNFLGGGVMDGNVVSVIHNNSPAPMGIGDFGVRNTSGTPVPYVLDSTSWEGSFTFNSGDLFYIDNDGPDVFGVQLNTVLTNVTVGLNRSGVFWTQDVMFYQPSTGYLQFLDNIWNFSNPSTAEPASTFYQYNGTPVGGAYYYDRSPAFNVSAPFTVHLYTNASQTNKSGITYSTVRFGYHLDDGAGITIASGIYDTVLFSSQVAQTSTPVDPHFQVNGGRLTPTNFLLYDSELMIGGPGGGSTTQAYALNASMQLQYWNASASQWQNDPTAWSSGTDTGETSEGVAEHYTTPGTMILGAGPSIVEPMWNATPGGNAGALTLRGNLNPSNAFAFISNGSSFWAPTANWAPTAPGASSYAFTLPPGSYSADFELSEYDPDVFPYSGAAGATIWANVSLTSDPTMGVYTPLFAWNNAQLATISSSGSGTAAHPFYLDNDQITTFSQLYAEVNDFLFPVFPGVLISNTTDYFVLQNAPSFSVVFPAWADPALAHDGLPDTDQLQIELYDTLHATLWGGQDIGGWLGSTLFSFPPYNPTGEVVLWGATDSLIGDNHFLDQGVGIVLMQGSGNVVWGNTFENGLLYASSFPTQFAIWEYESGDTIYNNFFNTSYTAYSPSENLYNGNPQSNVDTWNLGAAETSTTVTVVNGFNLTGSVVGAPFVCGNWWDDYATGDRLPFQGGPDPIDPSQELIASGGDACPDGPSGSPTYAVTFTEVGDTSGTWSASLAGSEASALAGTPIVFYVPNGVWNWTIGAVTGLSVSPASGSVTVYYKAASVPVTFSPSTSVTPATYLVTFEETGLATGTSWSVVLPPATTYSSHGSEIAFLEGNGSYTYSLPSVADYSLAVASGSFAVNGEATPVPVAFTPNPGWLNATVDPTTASVWVNGASVPLATGAFSLEESPGTYALEATASGYAPYYNNVTLGPGSADLLAIHLTNVTPVTNHSSTTTNTTTRIVNNGLTNTQFYAILGGLIVAAVAILVAAFLLRGRSRGPPPMEAYAPATPPAAPPTEGSRPPG